jgi:hypothetical protein
MLPVWLTHHTLHSQSASYNMEKIKSKHWTMVDSFGTNRQKVQKHTVPIPNSVNAKILIIYPHISLTNIVQIIGSLELVSFDILGIYKPIYTVGCMISFHPLLPHYYVSRLNMTCDLARDTLQIWSWCPIILIMNSDNNSLIYLEINSLIF